MSTLDEALPRWEHELTDAVVIAADRATVFEAMGGLRSGDSRLATALGAVRSGEPAGDSTRSFMEEMADDGWVELSHVDGREIAAGLIGRVWRRDVGIVRVGDRDAFVAFDEPGYAKILFSWRLEDVGGPTRLTATTRVHTTSTAAARLFRIYWAVIALGARLTVRSGLQAIRRSAERRSGAADSARGAARPWLEGAEGVALLGTVVPTWLLARKWLDDVGTSEEERARGWPGDAYLPSTDTVHTRALDIDASAATVWPWLLQWGLGRGGFHSYEMLENAAGLGVVNTDYPLPDLKPLTVGDYVLLAPDAPLWVAEIQPERALCFRTWEDDTAIATEDPATIGTFSLYLEPTSAEGCRLVLRSCKHERRPSTPGARLLGTLFEDPLDWVMEQRMMRTIRRLAESVI